MQFKIPPNPDSWTGCTGPVLLIEDSTMVNTNFMYSITVNDSQNYDKDGFLKSREARRNHKPKVTKTGQEYLALRKEKF